MSNLSPEQSQYLDTVFSFANAIINKHPMEQMIAVARGEIPCPKRLLHSVTNVRLLIETGKLDPMGHAASSLYDVMAFIEDNPSFKEMARTCKGCDPE